MRSSQVYVRSDWLLAHRANRGECLMCRARISQHARQLAGILDSLRICRSQLRPIDRERALQEWESILGRNHLREQFSYELYGEAVLGHRVGLFDCTPQ